MSRAKKIIIVLGAIFAIIIIAVSIAFYATSSLTKTIDAQLDALKAGDVEKAYSYTSRDFQNSTSLSEFEGFIDHYPSLKSNKSSKFTTKEISNDTGLVKGTLYSRDGAATPIEYHLIKENNEWKILGIQVNPAGVVINSENGKKNEEASSSEDNLKPLALTKEFDNKDSRYKIKYPTSWEFDKSDDGTVIFSGKRGTLAYYSTVNIQTVLTKKTGGDFATVKQFMSDIKDQAAKQSLNVKFVENGSVTVNNMDGTKAKGEYAIFTYKYKGNEFKQWQVVIIRNDEQVFYAWAYTSPAEQYSNYQDVAKAMLESWVIY